MFARIAPTLLAFTAAAISVNALTVSTPPEVTRCNEVTFNIGDAQGQVYVTVLPAENTCESDSIAEYGPITLTDGKYTWTPELAPGTAIVVLIDDVQTGEEAWSAPFTIGGTPDECVAAVSPPASSSSTSTSAPTNTNRPFTTNNTGNGNGNNNDNVDTPENAAEGTDGTPGAAVKTQISMGLFVALAGVVAAFA